MKSVRRTTSRQRDRTDGFENAVGAWDVRVDEGFGTADLSINMTLRSDMQSRHSIIVTQKLLNQRRIAKIAFDRSGSGGTFGRRALPRIGQCVEDNQLILRLFLAPVMDKIPIYKTSAAGYEQASQALFPLAAWNAGSPAIEQPHHQAVIESHDSPAQKNPAAALRSGHQLPGSVLPPASGQ